MKIINDNTTLENFQTWSGATDTKEIIIEQDKQREFDILIGDLYPNGLTDTQLNDILWFEDDWVFETLGIDIED